MNLAQRYFDTRPKAFSRLMASLFGSGLALSESGTTP